MTESRVSNRIAGVFVFLLQKMRLELMSIFQKNVVLGVLRWHVLSLTQPVRVKSPHLTNKVDFKPSFEMAFKQSAKL